MIATFFRALWCRCVPALLLTFLFVAAHPACAQEASGSILGVLKDDSGAVIPNAKVTLVNTDTNETRAVTTADDGAYTIPALRAGHYQLTFEAQGFSTQLQKGLTLDVAQQLVANGTMKIGSTAQEVTVTGEAPVVNTTSSTLGGLVNEQRIADLPLNGRNYIDLTLIQPGIQQNIKPAGGGTGASGTWYSSNGAPARSNTFTIDGTLMNNQFWTGANSEAGTTLGVDGIKEYRVITNMFSADYGMTMGSQMVIVSKGGSNEWHGDVFEYLRNNHLDARNYFDPAPSILDGQRLPQFKRNNFGASVGGPIQKDKTFFFLVYEGLRMAQGDTIQDVTLPAACHYFVNPAGGAPLFDLAQQFAMVPGGAHLATPSACNSGLTANSVVPAVVQPWIGQFPLPNEPTVSGGLGYTFSADTGIREDYSQLRIDHTFSPSDTVFARYTFDDAHISDPYPQLNPSDTGSAYPQFSVFGASRNQWLTLGWNHIFSASLLNTFHPSFSRTYFAAFNSPNTTSLNPFGPLQGPQWSFVTGHLEGGYSPGGGTTSLGPATTYRTYHYQNIYTLADDLFYTTGKHSLRFGGVYNRFQEPNMQEKGDTGTVSFSTVAQFMQGFPQTELTVTPDPNMPPYQGFYLNRDFMFNTIGMYVQDDWRIKPRLTLNLGLRYEFMTSLHELDNRESTVPDIQTSSRAVIGEFMDNPTYRNISPRVGLAWDVFGNGKTAIRSGFGIYYDVGNIGGLLTQSPQGVPPFADQTQVVMPANTLITIPLTFTAAQLGKALQMSDYQMKEPHSLQYNMTLDQQLPWGLGLTVSYVGTHGINLYAVTEGNPVVPASYDAHGYPVYNVAAGLAGCQNNAYTVGLASSFTALTAPCRVNPFWTTAIFITARSTSYYNGLQTVVTKRLSHGLDMQAAYTWSRDLDTTTGQMFGTECGNSGNPVAQTPLNLKLSYGPACFDVPQSLHMNLLYHFPTIASNGLLSKVVNGWWVGNIVTVQSGVPFTPVISTQRSFDGVTTGGDYADVVTAASAGTGKAVGASFVPYNKNTVITGNPNQWFNPYMFELTPLGTVGNAGRDMLRGPGLTEWDFSIVKDTKVGFLGEAGSVQFRGEFFNLMNHANFGLPNGTAYSGATSDTGQTSELPLATAGQILTTVTTSRQIQLALKLIF